MHREKIWGMKIQYIPKDDKKPHCLWENVILTIIRRSFDHPHLEKSVNGTLNVHLYGTSSEEEVLQLSHTIEVEPSTKHFLKVSTQSFCSNLKTHETPLNRKATKNQLKMFIYSETSREDANELSKWRFFFIFNWRRPETMKDFHECPNKAFAYTTSSEIDGTVESKRGSK